MKVFCTYELPNTIKRGTTEFDNWYLEKKEDFNKFISNGCLLEHNILTMERHPDSTIEDFVEESLQYKPRQGITFYI